MDHIQSLAMLNGSVFFIKYKVNSFRAGSTDNSRRYSASGVGFQNIDWSKVKCPHVLYLSNHRLRDAICGFVPVFLGYHLLLLLTPFGSEVSHCNTSHVRTYHFVWRAHTQEAGCSSNSCFFLRRSCHNSIMHA